MHLNYLAFAVPLFVGLMLLEYYYSKKLKKENIFHFNEAIANVNVGIAERLTDLLTTGLFFLFFSWIYENFALFNIKANVFTWIFLFLLTDFMWYWYHRFGHEVNIFWGVHVVHHQSEDFNYTVSGRITVFQAAARCLFWAVLPLVGFDPKMITILLLIHGAYPFFTHTQLVGKLGFVEKFLVTPSHHRVHHSSNPEYLDKNYGDVLIIWDKLFGTFAEEKTKPVYGLTTPLESYSFLWQHFHFLLEMLVAFQRAKGFRQKWKVIFGKPDNIPETIRPALERLFIQKTKGSTPAFVLNNYIKIQTVVSLSVLFLIILFEHYLTTTFLALASIFILVSVVITGAMLEQRRWIFYLEYIRAGIVCIIIYLTLPYQQLSILLFMLLAVAILFYKSCSKYYFKSLYR